MKTLLSRASIVLLLLLCHSRFLVAQSGMGAIKGTVVDESGGVIPGASLRLVEVSTKSARNAITNESGIFVIPSVPPGTYSLTISKDLFMTKQIDALVVNSLQELVLGRVALDLSSG